jgi:hypothetical protein
VAALWLAAAAAVAPGQDMPMPGMESGFDNGAAPMSDFGAVNFFSQDLGTVLRLRYNTESYGQNDHGNFDIGTMQVLTCDDWIAFCDGQVTMNDVQGVGFNVGTGLRWMTYPPYSLDGRIDGVSIWADGTSTEEGNFYPQLGISYESLGEAWDLRANGYTPLGPQDQLGDFVPTGAIDFQGNSISRITEAVVNSSLYSAEVEIARRLGPERDAWAFAGPYYLANDDDDSFGYRAGVRGYAYPDLLLQIAVSDDEIFHTNATFSVVWFVGRTRTDYQPACGVPDRFREPVMRHDYVILAQSTAIGGIPLTQNDGSALRVVHINGNTTTPGDGTFERPLAEQQFDEVQNFSQDGDIILAWAGSVFTGEGSAVLQEDQRFLGEGDGLEHVVITAEEGTIPIPETRPGARNLARPMIVDAIGDAIVAANGNEVANFDFEGGTGNAIFGNNLTTNVNFHHMDVTDGGDFAIALSNVATTSAVSLDEFRYDGGAGAAGGIQLTNFDGTFTAFDSTFTNGTMAGLSVVGDSDGTVTFQATTSFSSVDGTAVDINGDVGGADQLGGTITINSAITNDTGRSVSVQGLAAAANIDFTGNVTDTGTGILVNSNAGGTTTFATGTLDLDLDTAGATAIAVTNNAVAATTEFLGPISITNTSSANGFVATDGGTLEVSNTGNSISTVTGQVVRIEDTTIAGDGVNFADINRTAAAATSAVELRNNSNELGPITLGVPGDTAGESGTITGGTADAIVIDNSPNVSVSGITINNTSAVSGVLVNKTTSGDQTVNLNNLRINSGNFGVEVTANGAAAGDLVMTINDTEAFSSTDAGMSFGNVDNGSISVFNATIDGNNAGAAADGVRITDSNASITFDIDTTIQEFSGTDFQVDGGSGTISFAGDIRNSNAAPTPGDTLGRSVEIRTRTGGSVTFTSTSNITDDNQGVLVQNNSGGTVRFDGTNDLDTGANQALTVSGNTGGTYNFNNFDITTTSGTGVSVTGNSAGTLINFNGLDINSTAGGTGFNAVGPGTLTVSGAGNTIMTTTGTGLNIQDMTIGDGGVAFQSVNVNGAVNAIMLEDLTGTGLVLLGDPAGALNSGGTLTTTGTAIIVRNVQLAELNNLRIASAGDDGLLIEHTSAATTTMEVTLDSLNIDATTNAGIDIAADNDDNEFRLRLRDSDLEENVAMAVTGNATVFLLVENTDITVSGAADAFALTFAGGARNGEITFQDNNNFSAGDGRALFIDSTGPEAKLIDLLVEDSDFFSMNNAIAAADIRSRDNTTLNATIEGNTFDAPAAANDFDMRTDSATGRIRLKLGGVDAADMNTADGGAGTFIVREITGDFDIFEVNETATLDSRNQGAVDTDPNDAAFDDLPAAPPRPDLP